MEKFSTLSYNKEIDRYVIGTRQLHCGDCFQVKIENDVWKDVRIEKGTKKEKQEIAKKMLEKGFSITEISDITELTKEEIEKL